MVSIVDSLNSEMDYMCEEAVSIALIPDGWKQPSMSLEFMGLGAFIINNSFEKRLLVLGMGDISSGHTAEQTRDTIENIVNKFKFDKSKIRGSY